MTRTSFSGKRLLASLRAFFAHSPLYWTRRFAVLSLACIALSALTSATLLSRHVSERMTGCSSRAFLACSARRYGKGPLVFSAEALQRMEAHSWPGNVR